jgi:hypothetical protein
VEAALLDQFVTEKLILHTDMYGNGRKTMLLDLKAELEKVQKVYEEKSKELDLLRAKMQALTTLVELYKEPVKVYNTTIAKSIRYNGVVFTPTPAHRINGRLDRKHAASLMMDMIEKHGPLPTLVIKEVLAMNTKEFSNVKSSYLSSKTYLEDNMLHILKPFEEVAKC